MLRPSPSMPLGAERQTWWRRTPGRDGMPPEPDATGDQQQLWPACLPARPSLCLDSPEGLMRWAAVCRCGHSSSCPACVPEASCRKKKGSAERTLQQLPETNKHNVKRKIIRIMVSDVILCSITVAKRNTRLGRCVG